MPSFSPYPLSAGGVIGIHIADLSSSVLPGSLLDEVARLRLQSIYAAAAPLHMLPPTLLHAASLSDEMPNE
jgi:exoribonuclease R